MFARTAVFLLFLVTFVNAAPITVTDRDVGAQPANQGGAYMDMNAGVGVVVERSFDGAAIGGGVGVAPLLARRGSFGYLGTVVNNYKDVRVGGGSGDIAQAPTVGGDTA